MYKEFLILENNHMSKPAYFILESKDFRMHETNTVNLVLYMLYNHVLRISPQPAGGNITVASNSVNKQVYMQVLFKTDLK